ncbi:MAG: hypothetical protein KDE08_07375 [Rhodobacteraceae bacterium]|nr:hypothetical protein [Paracoccaceae bacterium]
MAAVVLVMLAARLILVSTHFDPAYDQSMLLANFPLSHPADVLRPLPYFEQTTTLGHAILMDLLGRVFGPEGMARIDAIRLLTALAFCAALPLFYAVLRAGLTPTEAILSVAILGSSPTTVVFSANSKHYGFEFIATIMLLAAAMYYLRHPSLRRGLIVVMAGLAVSLFAFTAPLIIAAIGLAVLAVQAKESAAKNLPAPEKRQRIARTLTLGLTLVAIAGFFYLGYTRVVTVYDLVAFADRDAARHIEPFAPLSQQSLRTALEYGTYLFKFFELGLEEFETPERRIRIIMALPVLPLYVAGLYTLWRRAPFWVLCAVAAPALTLLLNMAGAVPFSGVRQHLFAAPLVGPVLVVGLVAIIRRLAGMIRTPRVANVVIAALAVTSIALSVIGSTRPRNLIGDMIDRIEASGAPVWAYYGAQPIIRTLRPGWMEGQGSPALGLLPHTSSNARWLRLARFDDDSGMRPEYYRASMAAIAGTDRLWLVFANWQFDFAHKSGLELFLRPLRGPGRDCGIWNHTTRALIAFCGPVADVTSLRQQLPGDISAEWDLTTASGAWLRYVKGTAGDLVRASN